MYETGAKRIGSHSKIVTFQKSKMSSSFELFQSTIYYAFNHKHTHSWVEKFQGRTRISMQLDLRSTREFAGYVLQSVESAIKVKYKVQTPTIRHSTNLPVQTMARIDRAEPLDNVPLEQAEPCFAVIPNRNPELLQLRPRVVDPQTPIQLIVMELRSKLDVPLRITARMFSTEKKRMPCLT